MSERRLTRPSPSPFLLARRPPQDVAEAAPTHDEDGNALPVSSQPKIQLLAAFLSFISAKLQSTASSSSSVSSQDAAYDVLLAAFAHFTAAFLTTPDVDVHSLVQAYDPDSRKEILTAYFQTLSLLEGRFGKGGKVPKQPKSWLMSSAEKSEAEIYALFGGQGTNEVRPPFTTAPFFAARPPFARLPSPRLTPSHAFCSIAGLL